MCFMDKEYLSEELKQILADNYSGSTELLSKLNGHLRIRNYSMVNLRSIIPILAMHFYPFQNISVYLNELAKLLASGDKSELSFFYEKYAVEKHSFSYMADKLLPLLNKEICLTTLSNSGTIKKIINYIKNKVTITKIYLLESRPLLEGHIMATELAESGINVELIVDASAPEAVRNSDCVIIGADKILSNGNVVNKIGSKMLAICAEHYDKPFYVLAQKTKISSEIDFNPIASPQNEISSISHPFIKINNYYFEEVESNMISSIICD